MVAKTPNPRKTNRGQFAPGESVPEVAEKWAAAVRLRASGMGYVDIARSLGYADASGAHKAVHEGLRESLRAAGSEDLRAIEAERLDRMQMTYWQKAVGGRIKDKAGNVLEIEPDPEMTALVLRIMDRRARLLGLDAPVKLQHSGDAAKPVVVKMLRDVSMDDI